MEFQNPPRDIAQGALAMKVSHLPWIEDAKRDDIPDTGVVLVLQSDDVMDDEDWTITAFAIKNDHIEAMWVVQDGIYSHPLVHDINGLIELTKGREVVSHPQYFVEVLDIEDASDELEEQCLVRGVVEHPEWVDIIISDAPPENTAIRELTVCCKALIDMQRETRTVLAAMAETLIADGPDKEIPTPLTLLCLNQRTIFEKARRDVRNADKFARFLADENPHDANRNIPDAVNHERP